jgi:hypothetical protein
MKIFSNAELRRREGILIKSQRIETFLIYKLLKFKLLFSQSILDENMNIVDIMKINVNKYS